MPFHVNLSLRSVACEVSMRKLLALLADGPRLASELPRSSKCSFANALIALEDGALAKAECIARHAYPELSVWRWSITPRGKRWLAKEQQTASRVHGKQRDQDAEVNHG